VLVILLAVGALPPLPAQAIPIQGVPSTPLNRAPSIPAGDPAEAPDEALSRLLAAQLALHDAPAPHTPPPGAWDGPAADARAVFAELRAGPPADRTAFR
jgi:hypothetical protein